MQGRNGGERTVGSGHTNDESIGREAESEKDEGIDQGVARGIDVGTDMMMSEGREVEARTGEAEDIEVLVMIDIGQEGRTENPDEMRES